MIQQFQSLQSRFALSPVLSSAREQGRVQFEKLGAPTRKNEAWHYTSLKELSSQNFDLALLSVQKEFTRQEIGLINSDFYNLVFIDGQLNQKLSDWSAVSGVTQLEEISSAQAFSQTELADLLPLEALNQSYLQQGFVLTVPKNKSLMKPLQILSVITNSKTVTHPRWVVNLEEGSKLCLIESYQSLQGNIWQNSVAKINVARSAKLEYLRLQDESKGSFNTGLTRIDLNDGSELESLSFMVGAKLGRHDLVVTISGENASARVQGLTLAAGSQHLDHNTLIDHRVGHSTTSQLYKTVLSDRARSVFTGMVKIRQGAQKASSEQLNNNLLLSREAEADSRPQLEILADDVKATHGSTVGQLNPEELFYLLSRAIPREQALEMLSLGFVQDLVFQVSDLRVQSWLSQNLIQNYRASNPNLSVGAK